MTFKSIFPFNSEVIGEYPLHTEKEILKKIGSAEHAFVSWRLSTFHHRADLFQELSALLTGQKESLAKLITQEMGKTLMEARAEIQKCADCCLYYSEHGESILESETILSEASKSYVRFEPTGCVFAVMPWNFPFWQVFRYAIPTILAGNVGLLKHAPNVCGCALAIERLFKEAGFPDGVFQTLLIDVPMVEKIIQSDIVQGVTLTGSEYAGSSVAALAGKHIKKTVMELGGSDPFIVLADADLELAAKWAVISRMQNAGQSCIAAKRFIVDHRIQEPFVSKLKQALAQIRQGNPLLEDVTMGPVARLDLAEKLEKQYFDTVKAGVKIESDFRREGCNISPVLFTNPSLSSPAFQEELFGPLMAVFSVNGEDEAMQLANQTRYGLGASLWTEDIEKAQHLAGKIQAGGVFINAMVKSDPHLPFGGIKKSGYGRELSHFGMREFMNVKTVYIN